MKRFFLVTLALACAAGAAFGGSICPAGSGSNPFTHNPDNAATGCNVVITIAANGNVTVVVTDSTPYENSEDVLVGVVNNSAKPVGSVAISGSGVFGLDGDGICTFTFVGSGYCSGALYQNDPGDYYGPTSTYTNIASGGSSGTVNFSPALPANGGTSYFSLEGLPTASLGVVATSGSVPSSVPAPDSITLLGFGLALAVSIQAVRSYRQRQTRNSSESHT